MFDRPVMLERLEEPTRWDVIVIGGGATGLGCAIDAASRGYRTLLLEQSDFAKGTSSRSTKLVHGGVRYLQQGHVGLVLGALRERGRLQRNAAHLVHPLAFVIPTSSRWQGFFYGTGLRVYDLMARGLSFGRSRNLSREQTRELLPTINTQGLHGGVVYYDGQFDDARLAVNMAQTAAEQGAALLNYCPVRSLMRDASGRVAGVVAEDVESGRAYELQGRVVINATGPFSDAVRQLDEPGSERMIRPSQGAHVVLDRRFLPGDAALMVPRTSDGRVLFAIPWQDRVVVGTTDTPVEDTPLEPRPMEQELAFLFEHAGRYLAGEPGPSDALSCFTGLRPLVAGGAGGSTARISRDHTLTVSDSGLVTIAGGKWTTYRKMAEDTIDRAAQVADLPRRGCTTADLALHGCDPRAGGALERYGSDAGAIERLIGSDGAWGERIHAELPHVAGEVIWQVRYEMARTVEDVLARRTRSLVLDARASLEAAEGVARLMAGELGRDEAWQREQVEAFRAVAACHMVGG